MPYGTEYAIRYYRDEFWADKFRAAGWPGKPVGWHLSPFRYNERASCIRDVAHINSLAPTYPVEVVVLRNGIER